MNAPDPIKVYDARWEEQEFDDDQVRRLFEAAVAYGRELNADTVVLARDGRLAAGRVAELAAETAVRMGMRTYLCADPVGTPHGYFLFHHVSLQHPATMGLMITASHNPRQYIGVKFVVPGVQAVGLNCGPMGGLARVREHYHAAGRRAAVPGGRLRLINRTREFIEFSIGQSGLVPGELSGLKVVIDGMHGSAGAEMALALQQAGAEIEALRIVPDGRFPTGSPNPTSRGKMDAAVRRAAETGCRAVVGLDGDGDRLVLGDGRGILSAGFAAVAVLEACGLGRGAKPLPVLHDPKVSPPALACWRELNAVPVLFRNGHSQIKEYMRRTDALAAAEESGHYYHRITMAGLTAWYENPILTALLFAASIHRDPGLMDRLWALQHQVLTTGEYNCQFPDDDARDRALAEVIRRLVDEGAETATATDDGVDLEGTVVRRGVRLDGDEPVLEPGWYSGYLRIATNEKAVARSYFSAADPAVLEVVQCQVRTTWLSEFGGRVIE